MTVTAYRDRPRAAIGLGWLALLETFVDCSRSRNRSPQKGYIGISLYQYQYYQYLYVLSMSLGYFGGGPNRDCDILSFAFQESLSGSLARPIPIRSLCPVSVGAMQRSSPRRRRRRT